jgi:hypothetical protein
MVVVRRRRGRRSMYCVGQGSRLADVVQERRFGRNLRAEREKAVDEKPGSKGLVDVRSECTKMGGCVGLRLNRVSWSYVLAFGGISLQNLHSPFSIWLVDGTGHRAQG